MFFPAARLSGSLFAMPVARKDVVIEGEVGTYLCVSRCVRRAFLCGYDQYAKKDYEHRKEWVRQRLRLLAGVFAVDVIGYAVMSNHTHCILRTRPDLADGWTDADVARRWLLVFPKRKDENGVACPPEEREILALCMDPARIAELRKRLASVSWFMRCLNEYLARRANKEDGCTGRFWEGRFNCKAVLDEAGLLAGMVYTDLNLIRAQVAQTPEECTFSSAHDRIVAGQATRRLAAFAEAHGMSSIPATEAQIRLVHEQERLAREADWLTPIDIRCANKGRMGALPMTEEEYLSLLDWTGRQLHSGKRGTIPAHLASILTRMDLAVSGWVEMVDRYGSLFWRVVGQLELMAQAARRAGRKWFKGKGSSRRMYATADP
jgi:hypothetical protein